MKKRKEEIEDDFGFEVEIHPRETEVVHVEIPKDALKSLKKVAASREMSYQALLKFYIGQGLRQDAARLFGDHVLETTEEVLSKHIESEEEVASILREIKGEVIG